MSPAPNTPRNNAAIMNKNKITHQSTQVATLIQQGLALHQQGKFNEAKVIYEKILKIQPNHFDALQLLGTVSAQTKQFTQAVDLLTKALQINPNHAYCHSNRGNILQELKRFDEALASYDKAISIKTDYVEAYSNRGLVLKELNRLDDALSDFDQAIRIKADYAEAYSNRGLVLKELNRLDDALASYDKAINIKPDYAETYNNRGLVLKELNQLDDALASYEKAISLAVEYAEAYSNRGLILQELKYLDQALDSYDKAISIKADYADAYYNRGNVLKELNRLDDALASYCQAISIKGDHADAYYNHGNALQELKRSDEALLSYEKSFSIHPDKDFLLGNIHHVKMLTCNWKSFYNQKELIIHYLKEEKKVSPPFPLLALTDSPETLRQCAEIYINDKFPFNNKLGFIPKRLEQNKIRIGYYSADFHNHATAHLLAEFFELHDKNRFELIAFSFGPITEDEMRTRLSKAFDQFIDVRNQTDQTITQLSRQLGIDIAIDLKGFTGNARTGIFAYRAAPIQINYLGYPGTIAAKYMDYIVADRVLIPFNSQQHYSEKIVYLPNTYQVNDRKRVMSEKLFSRKELGLPESGFVFCCFNNNYKITPATFDVWMRILTSVQGSVLWLFEDNSSVATNLKKEAQTRGIDPNRLVFAKRIPLAEHLARHQQADLFIDTHPCNAHTTASDALWAGLPVLTMMGESFASRVAASLLNAIDLPELITTTQKHYEELAIELATHPIKLAAIKKKLAENRLITPLFNAPLFTKHMEASYRKMMERYWADLPPDHISIGQ